MSKTAEQEYLGDWQVGDLAIYSDFGLRSLYIVQVLPWPERLGDRFGTLTKGPFFLPPVMHQRSEGSVRAEIVNTDLVDWDFPWRGKPLMPWQQVGSVHYYEYTNLYRSIFDLIHKEARILYPDVQQRTVGDLMESPGWKVLESMRLVSPTR